MQLDGVAVPIGSLGLSYFLQVCHFVGFNMNTNKEILIRVENVEIILNQVQISSNYIEQYYCWKEFVGHHTCSDLYL
jgi:hypothetical protein